MRAQDLHMGATIDPQTRTIMVSGGIDRNEHTIVLRVPVPATGVWTVTKAEVNLTDQVWYGWQITLGKGVSMPMNDPAGLLLSRQFRKCRYLPERGAILFYDGEVRPGDAIFKMARLHVAGNELVLSHSRTSDPNWITDATINNGFGDDFPRIEVFTPVRLVKPGDIDLGTFPGYEEAQREVRVG